MLQTHGNEIFYFCISISKCIKMVGAFPLNFQKLSSIVKVRKASWVFSQVSLPKIQHFSKSWQPTYQDVSWITFSALLLQPQTTPLQYAIQTWQYLCNRAPLPHLPSPNNSSYSDELSYRLVPVKLKTSDGFPFHLLLKATSVPWLCRIRPPFTF